MPRRPAQPQRAAYDRAAQLRQHLAVVALLRERPAQTEEIATLLEVGRRTAERIVDVIREAGLGLTTETRGRERWHRLPSDTLRRTMP